MLLYGPYGEFGDKVFSGNNKNVFIEGGIGVTPFLSVVNYIVDSNIKSKVILYYLCRGEEDAVYKKELLVLSKKAANVEVVFYDSSKKDRFTVRSIKKSLIEKRNTQFFVCGPFLMMGDIKSQLVASGVDPKRITLEDFDIKN